jgi:hypothetical protein
MDYELVGETKVPEKPWRIDNLGNGALGLDYEPQHWDGNVLGLTDHPSYGAGMGLKTTNIGGNDQYFAEKSPQQALNDDKDFTVLKNGDSEYYVMTFRTYLFKTGTSSVPLGYFAWSFFVPVSRDNNGNVHLGKQIVVHDGWKNSGTFKLPDVDDYGPSLPPKKSDN